MRQASRTDPDMVRKHIAVVGLWHQATVVSACLADLGHQVFGVGDDAHVVARLNRGQPPVHEPRLGSIMRRNLRCGRLRYTTDYGLALRGAEFAYLAMDTPVGADDEPDVASVLDAARRVARAMSSETILIVSSQVPLGTCEHIAGIVREENPSARPDVVYVPEFLRLGVAVESFRRADRFVVGADDRALAEKVAAIYRPLRRPIVITDLRTAEMAKHASNAFLGVSISFINEIADLCEEVGADATQVARIMKLDRRIGKHAFLNPGLGFAGGTLGRDIRALQGLARHEGAQTPLLDAAAAVNRRRPELVGRRLRALLGSLQGCRVTILGLTYKAGTSTLRRSVALEIIRDLVNQGVSVKAFDPLARLDEEVDLPPFESCPDPYAAAEQSDALVLVTEWAGLEQLDWGRLRSLMRYPAFIDTRNLLNPQKMRECGFVYSSIGRGFRLDRSFREAAR